MLELAEKRTLHSKTHDLGNGQHRLTASMIPMHYEENGQLLDIDMTIQNGVVNSGLYRVALLTDKIGFDAIDRGSGKKITVSLGKIGNQSVQYSTPTIEGNKASWPSVKPGVDVEFIFNPHQVNIFRVLQNAQAEKVAEWDVEEEVGEKTIKMSNRVFGRDAAKKETKHTVIITPPENVPGRTTYTIRDTFEGKVFNRDRRTRVKTESTDVTYPVRIDPTVTITIANTSDDGFARKTTGAGTYSYFYTNSNQDALFNESGAPGFFIEARSFFRFPGITIPQSATINSATLKPYISTKNGANVVGKIQAKDLNNPNAPTVFADAWNPATLATATVLKTFTTASGNRASVNVSTIVQELVNSFDYSNEAMLFFIKPNSRVDDARLYLEDFSNPDNNPAQLVIDYNSGGGGSNIKTWNGLADASVKTANGLARASVKKKNGLA